MIKIIFIIISEIVLFDLHQGLQLDYDELKALGVACPPTDTCSVNRTMDEDNLFKYTCECKPSCRKYSTCCIDSPHNQPENPLANRTWPDTREESCMYLVGAYKTIVVKHKCRREWEQDSEVRSLCEAPVDWDLKDPVANLPVTNPKTSTTYKNYFCALCNDDIEDLVFWNINITQYIPKSDYEEVARRYKEDGNNPNLTFDESKGQWGSMVTIKEDNEGDVETAEVNDGRQSYPTSLSVGIIFTYPPSLRDAIISCSENLVSDCPSDWKDESVKKKCHSYMAMVYGDEFDFKFSSFPSRHGYIRFRNVHCAICNNAGNVVDLKCFFPIGGWGGGGDTMSFSWLLDINPSDGDRVGEINQCSSGEVYDPFFKKCRMMRCIKPGYKVRKGKCVPP